MHSLAEQEDKKVRNDLKMFVGYCNVVVVVAAAAVVLQNRKIILISYIDLHQIEDPLLIPSSFIYIDSFTLVIYRNSS